LKQNNNDVEAKFISRLLDADHGIRASPVAYLQTLTHAIKMQCIEAKSAPTKAMPHAPRSGLLLVDTTTSQ